MASVYSASFAQAAALTGTSKVTVPDGQVWVLKDIDVWADSSIEGAFILFAGYSGQIFYAFECDGTVAGSHDHWTGRIVLQPGQSFEIQVASNAWDVSVCGYSLSN